VYQGEEIGMVDVPPGARSAWSTHDQAGRDPARSPFDWDEAVRQRRDPHSLLAFYRSLIGLRRRTPALRGGTLTLLRDLPPGVLGYERAAGGRRLLIAANMGTARARVRVPDSGALEPIIGTAAGVGVRVEREGLVLDADEGAILRLT
jgi:glycosidase